MGHKVDPFIINIPEKFREDREISFFFDYFVRWAHDITIRTDDVDAPRIVNVTSTSSLDTSHFGALIVVDASGGAITITLPPITADLAGSSLEIIVIDATNDVTISPYDSGTTVLGDTDVIMTANYQSIDFAVETATSWMAL